MIDTETEEAGKITKEPSREANESGEQANMEEIMSTSEEERESGGRLVASNKGMILEDEPEAGSDDEPEAGSDDEPEAGSDDEPEAGSDDEPEAGNDDEPEAGSDDEPEAGSDDEDEAANDTVKSEVEDEQEVDVSPNYVYGKDVKEVKGKIFNTVKRYLDGDDAKYFLVPKSDIIRLPATGQHSTYNVIFDVKEDSERLIVYICCPIKIPEDRRLPMAEFLTRANFGLALGNFELDMNDGELRYKTSMDVEGGEMSCKMVQNMFGASTQTMERYFPGVMSVCFAGKDAAAAVAEVEGKLRFISQ